jgi:hypothetical protein
MGAVGVGRAKSRFPGGIPGQAAAGFGGGFPSWAAAWWGLGGGAELGGWQRSEAPDCPRAEFDVWCGGSFGKQSVLRVGFG